MGNRVAIKDFYGKILGYVTTEANGDKKAEDFYGKILGYYKAQFDHTTDFFGRILTRGDTVVGLIYSNGN